MVGKPMLAPRASGSGASTRSPRQARRGFHELMIEPGAFNADYADTFAIKLSGFAYISREEQIEILRHYRDYLLFSQKHVLAARQRVVSVPVIRDFERVHYLRMLDHKLLLLETDLAWIDAQIAGNDTASLSSGQTRETDDLASNESE